MELTEAMTRSDGGFRALTVWQRGQDLALDVANTIRDLPRDRSAETIGTQLLRAAGSVSANIAEGYGRFSEGAYRNHLSIARGSLFESESWIDLLAKAGYLDDNAYSRLISRCHEIGRLLTTQMRSLPSRGQTSIREEELPYEV
jgi:four helix bundle protein